LINQEPLIKMLHAISKFYKSELLEHLRIVCEAFNLLKKSMELGLEDVLRVRTLFLEHKACDELQEKQLQDVAIP